MTSQDARAAALRHLRTDGTLSADALRALCDGNEALAAHVRSGLVLDGIATEDGPDLRAVPTPPPPGEPEADLFVSYAHTDDDEFGAVRDLVQRVQTLQLDFEPRAPVVFYDRRDIHARHDWRHRIYQKIGEAKAMLIVLSPAYFASDFCRAEWELFTERERELAHSDGAILNLYAVEIPGFTFDPAQVDGTWMKDLARRQWITDVSGLWRLGPAMWDRDEAPGFIEKIRQELTVLVEHGERVLGSRSTVPRPSKYFVGRSVDLKELRDRLLDTRVGSLVAAQGLGGMGKSALAFEYARSYAADYPGGRYLVSAEGQTDLQAAVLSLAPSLGVEFSPEESRQTDVALRKVHAALTAEGQALVVLDNVSDPALLAPHQVARALPPTGVHVLATSRRTAAELHLDDAACQEVGPLPDEDALALLDRYRPFHDEPDSDAAREAARDIVARLGGYTLALEAVAVYLWQHRHRGVSYPGYSDRLREEGFPRLDRTGATPGLELALHAETRLPALLAPTLDLLTEAEAAVLGLAAVLPPDAVVWPWLRTLAAQTHPGLIPEHVEGDPDPWLTLKDRLHGLRLLTPTDDARISRMHRLVREVVRARLGAEVDEADAAAYEVMLARAKHLANDGWIDHRARWELIPLTEAVTWLGIREDMRIGNLSSQVLEPLWKLGQFTDVRRLLERAIGIQKKALDPDHPTLATSYSNLALVVQDQGDLAEARRLLQRAIEIEEKAFDPDHPTLATSYSNLASVVKDQGDLAEARRLIERAIKIKEKSSYPDHTFLATSYSNLALVVQSQGDLSEARRLLEHAIEIGGKVFDPDHPTLATSYSNLATVVKDQGDLAGARRLLERAIEIKEKAFDTNHPTLATSYSNLATVVRAEGDLAEARHLLERAIEIQKKAFDPDHLALGTSYSNLAAVVQEQGDLHEARHLLERAIEIKGKAFDPDHPTLGISYVNLGTVLWELGAAEEAALLYKTAFAIFLWRLGPGHTDVNLAWGSLHTADPAWVDGVKAGRIDPLEHLPRPPR